MYFTTDSDLNEQNVYKLSRMTDLGTSDTGVNNLLSSKMGETCTGVY